MFLFRSVQRLREYVGSDDVCSISSCNSVWSCCICTSSRLWSSAWTYVLSGKTPPINLRSLFTSANAESSPHPTGPYSCPTSAFVKSCLDFLRRFLLPSAHLSTCFGQRFVIPMVTSWEVCKSYCNLLGGNYRLHLHACAEAIAEHAKDFEIFRFPHFEEK